MGGGSLSNESGPTLHGVVFQFSVFARPTFAQLTEAQWLAHPLTDGRAAVLERL